jgi:TonB-dependent receptor
MENELKRYYQTLHDHIASASAGYKQPFRLGPIEPVLKTGAYGEFRTRDYTPRLFIYDFAYNEAAPENYLSLPFEQMLSEQYLGADKTYIAEESDKKDAYSADVFQAAGYAALDIPAGSLDIYVGARLESYTTRLTYDAISNASEGTLMKSNTIRDLNLLPSVNLTWRLSGEQQLRAAYGRSVNRPELRELAPTTYYDFDLFSNISGNPGLKTALIDNFDLRYEFYPAPGETVSIGAFYKRFKNPIELNFMGDAGGDLTYYHENATEATNWGLELDIRKNLDFLSAPNLTVVVNAAWIRSEVHLDNANRLVAELDRPMQGQSPYIVNAGLYYESEKHGLNLSLLYNIIGKRIIGVGKALDNTDPNTSVPNSYEMPRNSLDFNISKRLGRRVELRLSVKDVLSEDIVYKQFPRFVKEAAAFDREQITRQYNPGQSVSIGVSIKL